jgi:catechol 2,3-dioxygenase-like lactoylglutathione lyase family enzyme
MMGTFGRFLEVSVPTADILRSLEFYRALGFAEFTTGDIRRWHYAVVTDGRIAIGLHGGGIEESALSFVRPNLARQIHALEELGHEFEFRRLGTEEFNEAALRTPDGQLILMLEARTFSPGEDAADERPLIGHCTEVSLACADPAVTRSFFEGAGFLPADEEETDVVRLHTPGITLGLRETARSAAATLRFAAGDTRAVLRALKEKGVPTTRGPEGPIIKAPEGTRLIIG